MSVANVISLKTADSRRHAMKAMLEGNGIKFVFWNGFNPKEDLESRDMTAMFAGRYNNELSANQRPGTYGCTYSHLELWKHLQASNFVENWALIMEDDVSISPHFKEYVNGVLLDLPADFDFCFLAGWPPDCRFSLAQRRHSRFLRRMTSFGLTSTAIYLINTTRISSIFENILPICDEIDIHISAHREALNIYLYGGAFPCALTQVAMGSDRIANDKKYD
jgi:GR25 family glycosyltransferase involved in LPS biosynthesis